MTLGSEADLLLVIVITCKKAALRVTSTSPPTPSSRPHHGKLPPELNLAPLNLIDTLFLVLTLRHQRRRPRGHGRERLCSDSV